MSETPEERNRDSRKVEEDGIAKSQSEPLGKQDPTEPVEVGKRGKGGSVEGGTGAASV